MPIPSINLISVDALGVVRDSLKVAPNSTLITSLGELRRALDLYATRSTAPAVTVDLLGHSTRDHQLLRMGGVVLDALELRIRRYFEEIERSQVLDALHAVSLRLLGCETAVSPSGQRTLRMLADILGLPVVGTLVRLGRTHHAEECFNPRFDHVLFPVEPRRGRTHRLSSY